MNEPRLLLIHAFPLDASMWRAQKEAFPTAIAPDLPGFGGTGRADSVMTMAAAADRCFEALDRAGVERAVVCGLSMGGYVAFEMWRSRADRISGLIFANTRAEPDDEEGAAKRLALAERLRSEGSGFMVSDPPPLLSDAATDDVRGSVRDMIAAQPAESIAAAAAGMAERGDSVKDLAEIRVPTLVVNSSDDALIPAEITARIAEGISGAQLSTIEGAGHLSNLEAPDAFNELLRAHLARCDRPSTRP